MGNAALYTEPEYKERKSIDTCRYKYIYISTSFPSMIESTLLLLLFLLAAPLRDFPCCSSRSVYVCSWESGGFQLFKCGYPYLCKTLQLQKAVAAASWPPPLSLFFSLSPSSSIRRSLRRATYKNNAEMLLLYPAMQSSVHHRSRQ